MERKKIVSYDKVLRSKSFEMGLLLHIVEIQNFSVILCDTNFGNFKASKNASKIAKTIC